MVASNRILAMSCERTGIPLPPQGSRIRRFWSTVRTSFRDRAGLPLGAKIAIRNLYLAFLKHYTGERVVLFPSPQAQGALHREVGRLQQNFKLHPQIQVLGITEIRQSITHGRLHWFEPRRIDARLCDVRQAYFMKPFPLTWAHHAISYRFQLARDFLPLLLSDSLPCDSVVCSSQAARTAISKILEMIASRLPLHGTPYKGRLDVIPFGIDTGVFRPLDQRSCRRVLRLPAEATIVLYLGRISAQDKADLLPLAIAMSHVQKQSGSQPVLLIIAGKPRDNYSECLKRELQDRGLADSIRFIPYLTEAENPYLYSAADVFVSPSENIQETFGLVVLEAMACGLPQVVSDWDGYRDIVVHGETGFLIPTMWARCDETIIRNGIAHPDEWEVDHFQLGQSVCVDIRALTRALLELTRNRELRLRMSAASRLRAETLFDWRKIVRRYEELWTELETIALSLPEIEATSRSFRVPSYFRCFNHYVTTTIDENTLIVWRDGISDRSDEIVLPYRELFQNWGPFEGWNLDEMKKIVKAGGRYVRVGDVLNQADKNADRADAFRQLMWLLKYGYVQKIDGQEAQFPVG